MTCRGGKVGAGGDEKGRDGERGTGSSLVDDVVGRFKGEFYVDPECPTEVLRITGFDFVNDMGWYFKAAVHDRETGDIRTEETCVLAARDYEKVPLKGYSPWMRELRATGS
jgi:hypothetical protein